MWGIYLDELIQITTLVSITTGSGETAKTYDAGTYYALQDLLYRTTATVTVTEESVTIQEAYDFDAYGRTLIFNAAGTDDNWWADNARQVSNSLCQFLFTGQRFDAETGLYYYKRRYYSPALGRFLSRDPLLESPLTDRSGAIAEYATLGADLDPASFFGVTDVLKFEWEMAMLYSYCVNSPAAVTDPYGLAALSDEQCAGPILVREGIGSEGQANVAKSWQSYDGCVANCDNSFHAAEFLAGTICTVWSLPFSEQGLLYAGPTFDLCLNKLLGPAREAQNKCKDGCQIRKPAGPRPAPCQPPPKKPTPPPPEPSPPTESDRPSGSWRNPLE